MRAARRFFLGGSGAVSEEEPGAIGAGNSFADEACTFSSTLAAGVKGGSAVRFIGTTGVNAGEIVGNPTDCTDGVLDGVAIVDERGTEWWCAMDCN